MRESQLLARTTLLAPLSEEERGQIEKKLVRQSYDKDEYLFFEGDPAEW